MDGTRFIAGRPQPGESRRADKYCRDAADADAERPAVARPGRPADDESAAEPRRAVAD